MAPFAPSRLLPALVATLLLAVGLLAPTAAHAEVGTFSGTVTNYDDNPLAGATVELVPAGSADGAAVVAATTGADGVFRAGTADGSFWVRYSKAGYATAFLESGADDGPVTVTISGGQLAAPGLDVSDNDLGDVTLKLTAPTVKTKPSVTGTVAVGETIILTPGTWAGVSTDPDFLSADWYLDGEDASDNSDGAWFQKFDVPASAAGKELTFTVTVEDPEGAHETATYTGSAGKVAKGSVKGGDGKGKAKGTLTAVLVKRTLTITLTAPGVPSPKGSVVVKEKKKTLGTVTLKAKGKGKLNLKLPKGKHKLTLTYAGNDKVAPTKAVVKVTLT